MLSMFGVCKLYCKIRTLRRKLRIFYDQKIYVRAPQFYLIGLKSGFESVPQNSTWKRSQVRRRCIAVKSDPSTCEIILVKSTRSSSTVFSCSEIYFPKTRNFKAISYSHIVSKCHWINPNFDKVIGLCHIKRDHLVNFLHFAWSSKMNGHRIHQI